MTGPSSINGMDVEEESYQRIVEIIEATPRPHFCEFRRSVRRELRTGSIS